MATRRRWCEVCRGESEGRHDLSKCSSCPRRYHVECCPDLKDRPNLKDWKCPSCVAVAEEGGLDEEEKQRMEVAKEMAKKTRALHTALRGRSCGFFRREQRRLAPFVPADRLKALQAATSKAKQAAKAYTPVKKIGPTEEYIHAEIRPYQQEGVNWLLSQYDAGVGAILADEMGLGKTIQTLSFLSALKAAGMAGPHLVVTPLAVLQNWHNEIKRFTPGLSVIKVHGSRSERDRILSMPVVLAGGFDIYLTTYETVLSEEPFFTESFLFHTITIDEGHRLKNESGKLSSSLARVTVPFRLLLTGTPLQNNLNELWALMHYILPNALEGCRDTFDAACSLEEGQLDRAVVDQARSLLASLMLRRIKSEVETTLLPKLHWVLKVPLTTLQRQWYRRFLNKDAEAQALVTRKQLIAKIQQLQKIINHPKTILYALDREREQARSMRQRAEGSQFISLPKVLGTQTESAQMMEAELRNLRGVQLIESSGKLHLLDRLLSRVRTSGSRVLVFSQFTMTLDVLAEYCESRFGPEGRGFLRLDGSTNRIKREMDVRAFNASDSRIPIYLISTRAGGQGINLASADVVVLYDTCWNPQVDLQAQDRAHRIGQKKQVKVFRLIAEATLEERVLTRARQKLVLDALVIKNKEEASALANEVGDDADTSDEAAMEKLSLEELWSFLSLGSEQVQGPISEESVQPLSEADLDRIIDQGRTQESVEGQESEASGVPAALETETDVAAQPKKKAGVVSLGGVDLTVDDSDDSDDERGGKPRKFPKPRGRPPAGMRWNYRTGIWVPRTVTKSSEVAASTSSPAAAAAGVVSGQDASTEEEPNSINLVSKEVIRGVLGTSSRVAATILTERSRRPFASRQDCTRRVTGLGDSKLKQLEQAGVSFPSTRSEPTDVEPSASSPQTAGASVEVGQDRDSTTADDALPRRRNVKAVQRYEPPELHHNKGKRRKLRHEDSCFSCDDGGELLECSVCPKVYHPTLECAGLVDNKVPKGTWTCPWHACWDCDRKSSQAGGILFHCTDCPLAYCFDCAADKYTTQRTGTTAHKYIAATLENRGCASTKSYLFFTCDDCDPKRVAREKAEEEKRELQQKRAEAERQRLIAWNRPEAVAARAEQARAYQQLQEERAAKKREQAAARKKTSGERVQEVARYAWEQHLDASRGLMYWWNSITHVSTWTLPDDAVVKRASPGSSKEAHGGDGQAAQQSEESSAAAVATTSSEAATSETFHVRWNNEERRLYEVGMQLHGACNYEAIAKAVGTRNAEQIRTYSVRRREQIITAGLDPEVAHIHLYDESTAAPTQEANVVDLTAEDSGGGVLLPPAGRTAASASEALVVDTSTCTIAVTAAGTGAHAETSTVDLATDGSNGNRHQRASTTVSPKPTIRKKSARASAAKARAAAAIAQALGQR